MTFTVHGPAGQVLHTATFFSVGGGFIVRDGEEDAARQELESSKKELPLPFRTAAELLEHCRRTSLGISDVMLTNEKDSRTEEEIRQGLLHIYSVMESCAEVSLTREGLLLVVWATLPVVAVATVSALLISIIQAVTQLQDQSIGQSVRLVAVMITIVATGGWLGRDVMRFAERAFQTLAGLS